MVSLIGKQQATCGHTPLDAITLNPPTYKGRVTRGRVFSSTSVPSPNPISQHSTVTVVKILLVFLTAGLGQVPLLYFASHRIFFPPRVNKCLLGFHLLSCPTLCIVPSTFVMVLRAVATQVHTAPREFFDGSHHMHSWDKCHPCTASS